MRHDEHLELRCRGCGAVVALDRSGPLVPTVRPFVQQHRGCAPGGDVDQEMRSAFSRRG